MQRLLWPILALGLPLAATAQTAPTPAPDAYRDLYRTVAVNPGDPAALFELGRQAEARAEAEPAYRRAYRDLAIDIYRRVLSLDETAVPAMIRLAELHLAAGDRFLAREYFRQALRYPATPLEIRNQAAGYAGALDRDLAPSRFTGSVSVGLAHETNAGTEGEIGEILETERPEGLSSTSLRTAAQVVHQYDFGLQSGLGFETRLNLYQALHPEHDQFDTFNARLRFGPRLSMALAGGAASVWPHVLLEGLSVGNDPYAFDRGIGLEFDLRPSDRVVVALALSAVDQRHEPSTRRPNLEALDGPEYTGRLAVATYLTSNFVVGAAISARLSDADVDENDRESRGAKLWARLSHAPPAGAGRNWTTGVELGYERVEFDEPTEFFGSTDRRDKLRRIALTSEIPLTDNLSLDTRIGYEERDSNADVYDFDNRTVSMGLTYRF